MSTYLNFPGTTEEAFEFYKSVFGTDYVGSIARMGDAPAPSGVQLSDELKNKVMHVALPILGGHVLMGTDSMEELGHSIIIGTNIHLNLEPDTRAEADRLFKELAAGGQINMELSEMFWGAYFGSLTDRFGTSWMINCESKV